MDPIGLEQRIGALDTVVSQKIAEYAEGCRLQQNGRHEEQRRDTRRKVGKEHDVDDGKAEHKAHHE